jgi:hypothetical protein
MNSTTVNNRPMTPAIFKFRSKQGRAAIAGKITNRIPGANSMYFA